MANLQTALRELFTSNGGDDAGAAVKAYFSTTGDGYTGSQFELVADTEQPDEITARDMVAVTMLSVSVPARPARWLLSDEGRAEVGALLTRVPNDVDIWAPEAEALLAQDRPLWHLWDLLGSVSWPERRSGNGLGRTTRSKLLAAKRPRLVPVYDGVVAKVLQTDHIWRDFREMLLDEELRKRIEAVTPAAPPHLSLLRRVDIVAWMAGKVRA
jgi:hypothetical protein